LKAFPEEYEAHAVALAEEERHARLNTPVFVCQLSFPGVPTLLHFFEPRYRLMLRRLLATPHPAFGMIMRGSADFGTMLEVRSVQMLPDGRSMVETWGTHRFRILERGTLDGYMVARTDRIDDFEEELEIVEEEPAPTSPPSSPGLLTRIASHISPSPSPPSPTHVPTTRELAEICTAFLRTLSQGTAPWVVQRLNNTYGPPPSPENIAAFGFWVALVLPIDEEERAKLLPIRSARLRLRIVVAWINRLQRTWWFERGCSVM
jgi:Lon protease-like protein